MFAQNINLSILIITINLMVLTIKQADVQEIALNETRIPSPEILSGVEVLEVHGGSLVNVSDCLYHFSRGGRLTIHSSQMEDKLQENKKIKKVEFMEFTFNHQPIKANGNCSRSVSVINSHLQLVYELREATDDVRTLVLNFLLTKHHHTGHWLVEKLNAIIEPTTNWPNRNFPLNSKEIQAPYGFSYSCQQLELKSKIFKETVEEYKQSKKQLNKIEEETIRESIKLNFNRFQIQPFYSEEVFVKSFDCSTLFTMPQFAGLFSLILFTLGTAIGIYGLFRIKAMDRFDNLKSINLSIPNE